MRPFLPCLLAAVIGMAISGAALAEPAATPKAPVTASTKPLPVKMTAAEYRMGDPKAKVTVVEYASDTCSHCARFSAEVFPDFKKKYIDTGKVLYVFREFPTDPVELSAAGFMVARCAGERKYFDVVTSLFQAQKALYQGGDGLAFLTTGAKVGGLDDDQMKACIDDASALADLNTRVQKAVNVEKITGTPTFIINGKKLNDGEKTLKDLDAAIEPLLIPTKTKAGQRRRKA